MSTREVSPRKSVSARNQVSAGLTQRLNDTQRKTIEVLRSNALRRSGKRVEQLQAYAKELRGQKTKAVVEKPKARSNFSKFLAFKASMPLTAADAESVYAFLHAEAGDHGTGYLQFPDGVNRKAPILAGSKSEPAHAVGSVTVSTEPSVPGDKPSSDYLPSFGVDLSVSKKKLQFMFRYRPVSGSLRLPDNKRAQGDLSFRLAGAAANSAKPAEQVNKRKGVAGGSAHSDLNDAINSGVEALLTHEGSPNLLGYETPALDDVAWQDFSEYVHALPLWFPLAMYHVEPTPEVVGTLITVEEAGVDSDELGFLLSALGTALGSRIATDVSAFVLLDPSVVWHDEVQFPAQTQVEVQDLILLTCQRVHPLVVNALQNAPDAMATLAEIYWALAVEHRGIYVNWVAAAFRPADQEPGKFYFGLAWGGVGGDWSQTRWPEVAALTSAVWGWALKAQQLPPEIPPELIPPYDFFYYIPGTFNLGLRLVYRQEWRALGNQRGEVVKTIPLGPRQTEKVSTRITRRTKVVRTAEDLKSIETTTEVAASAKESSETLYETLNTSKEHIEADASANIGFASASVSGGYEEGEEERQKQTTTDLTERSQKMASKIRQETKVTVSTESESTFETTTATEITNPNEEIALTYVYSKLQRQYRLFTQLAEVHNVVMIAEPLPAPEQIDDAWVRRHDSVLAKALLDDSYREALASFGQDRPQESLDTSTLAEIKAAVDNIAGATGYLQKIGEKAVSISLDRVDPSQEAQRGYRDTQREELERKRAHNLLLQKQKRFKQHIRDNLLHYYRAIWSSEDPQQRALRYRKLGIQVPLHWEWVPGPPDSPGIQTLDGLRQALAEIADGTSAYGELPGVFRPIVSSEKVALADLINNSGPIGYEGNYAIYYLNPRFERGDLFLPLQFLKLPYLDQDEAGQQTLVSPTLRALRREHAGEGPASYLEQQDMASAVPELRLRHAIAKKEGVEKENEFFAVYKLTKDSIERLRAKGHVEAVVLQKLRLLQMQEKAAKGQSAEDFIKFLSSKLHADDVARHRELLLRYADQGIFTTLYPEYLLRNKQGSPFLLDTGNIVVDIVPGAGSALESFKLMHRGVDVLKALEERAQLVLDNKRRAGLIRDHKYGDPDIERVTIVGGAKDVAELVVAPIEAEEEGEIG